MPSHRGTCQVVRPVRRGSSLPLAHPRRGHGSPFLIVIHYENQLMLVVAVEDFDVDSRLPHVAGEPAELTRNVLLQSLHEHVALPKRGVGRAEQVRLVFYENPVVMTIDLVARCALAAVTVPKSAGRCMYAS